MHTHVTADIVAEVFQWSRDDAEATLPTTMTQLYTEFTCKLLTQHLKKDGSIKSVKVKTLEDIPAGVRGKLLEMCRLAWGGIVKQQLTFSGEIVLWDWCME